MSWDRGLVLSMALSAVLVAVFGFFIFHAYRSEPKITVMARGDYFHPKEARYLLYQEPVAGRTIAKVPPDWLTYSPAYTINRDTLNERRDYAPTAPARTFRIATLGDSWTFGQNVNTEDNYPEILEDLLNERLHCPGYDSFEVINLGSPSYDLQYAVERFRLRGQKYHPDLLIWLVLHNDFSEIAEEMLAEIRAASLRESHFGDANRANPDAVYDAARAAHQHLKERYSTDELVAFQERTLRSIREYFDKELLLYTLPNAYDVEKEHKPTIGKFVENGPQVRWLASGVDFQVDDRLLPDMHPSPSGHRAMAEELFRYLAANYTADCVIRE